MNRYQVTLYFKRGRIKGVAKVLAFGATKRDAMRDAVRDFREGKPNAALTGVLAESMPV